MYNNSSHYPNSGYSNTYQQYPTGYPSNSYNYQGYGQYPNQSVLPAPPGESPYQSGNNWSSSGYGSSTQKDAVAQEMQQQKAQLIKQREDYVKKVSVLRHELDQLRIQKQELAGDGRGSKRDLGNILKENDKLQEEIQGKMKAIQNVIEMLSSIIKDGQSMADLEAALVESETSKSSPPTKSYSDNYKHGSKTPEHRDAEEKFNYVHYDTGLHWCRLCDKFPETAKDLLLHLQEKKHRESAKQNDVDSTPWHKLPAEPVLPSYEDAPTKRIPIKGLQFFISAPSWYCKLCDIWIGDLHCASHHLKSQAHFQNYENFVAQNPQWEMEWLKDREKAMERKGVHNSSESSEDQKSRRRRKDKRRSTEFSMKDKKKKKRSKKRKRHSSDSSSSSSSSDSSSDDEDSKQDRSKSIRVAMRNVKKFQSIMEEDLSSKWSVLEKLVEEHKRKQEEVDYIEKKDKAKEESSEDPLINQWMTITPNHDKDRALLDSLKDRMRQKQEQEKARQAELERQKREKEREELEKMKRKELEEREAVEEMQREKKRREQEELERIRDKDRNQVRFKTNYRRRKSNSDEEDDDNGFDKYYRSDKERDIRERYRRDSEGRSSHRDRDTRSRSRSSERKNEEEVDKKKPPGPPSYKKLPFIGRMPLFKNKKANSDEKDKKEKEIKKESYEPQRKTRFEPGNLPKAFIPKPDVVCFPKLSSIPPLIIPPPPTVSEKIEPPEPPKISVQAIRQKECDPSPPPPPRIEGKGQHNSSGDLYGNPNEGTNSNVMAGQYYDDYNNMMYSHNMYYSQNDEVPPAPPAPSVVPHSHTLPLQPPPLPPDDDLALLGICADDMAAQSF